ncbi:MAG: hypothetical protein GY862_03695 [Gammaproteobacteria bacterium]|nr:hypothetical protein [Gammaproteobacteria bacterium]
MKWLLVLLLVISCGVVLGLYGDDPGFVVLGRGAWTLETSLTTFLVFLLALFVLAHFLFRLLGVLWHLPERWQSKRQVQRQGQNQTALLQGFGALMQGQWQRAERDFLRISPQFSHYLGAAYAAQQREALEQRDEYLYNAREQMPEEQSLAVNLFQAQLYMQHRQFTDALATLTLLRDAAPKHAQVLKMLMQAYLALENWPKLQELLPELRKRKVLSSAEVDELQIQTIQGHLDQTAARSADALDALWSRLPKASRLNPRILQCYTGHLLAQKRAGLAEPLVREALKQRWHSELAALYGELDVDSAQQLNHAETWLKKHKSDPMLLLALGCLCTRCRLWGKAQQYLESALNQKARPEIYRALGDLQSQIGDTARAAEYYRKGYDQ